MRLTISDCDFEILGDPHRGRPFRNGVPLHRLGDREKMQANTMKDSLFLARQPEVVAHICVGDLFDKARVPNEVVAQVADEYLYAIDRAPGVSFFCLTGNHDVSRDMMNVSSFQLFTRIVDDKMFVIREEVRVHFFEDRAKGTTCKIGLIPWHPLKTALEMVNDHAVELEGCDAVFGHWDVDRRLEGTDNYIPATRLLELGIPLAITGHDHLAREVSVDGLRTIVTGSMQPYGHDQDPDEQIYITMSVDEAQLAVSLDPDVFKDNCLRVIGDWDDEWPNCLQFTTKAASEQAADEALAEVQVAEFSLNDLWIESFEGVDPEISAELKAKFSEIGGEE